MSQIADRGYTEPERLVSTEWVQANIENPSVRIVESNEDQLLYKSGHIPGAVEVDWVTDLNHPTRRDYLESNDFAQLMSKIGATPETKIVFYGDKGNWWACYSLWVFQLFGHDNVCVMDGGSLKWKNEGRPITKDSPRFETTSYPVRDRDDTKLRAFREQVLAHVKATLPLIDVRSPAEFSGERLHMDGYPNEGALRGGHIPGARNVPWAKAINEADGTFKSAVELRALYENEAGLRPEDDVIAYCRIGERSSHTWFALKYLLGYPRVRNYDGSWTEWGNSVGVPIEK